MDQLKFKHAKKAKADEGDQLGEDAGEVAGGVALSRTKAQVQRKESPERPRIAKRKTSKVQWMVGQFFMGTPLMSGLLGMQHALGPKTMSTGKGLRLRHGTK